MIIGVFGKEKPWLTLSSERKQALVNEAKRQNVTLLFFEETGIDWELQKVEGMVEEDGTMQRRIFALPDVVIQEGLASTSKQSDVELRLRELVPFTTPCIEDQSLISQFSDSNKEMQQYWSVFTGSNEPIGYRIHIQRNGQGGWEVTEGSEPMNRKLVHTALQVAESINHPYPFLIDELSMDFLMNESGEIRFLKAVVGSEAPVNEAERAVRTIGYARYVSDVRNGRRNTGLPTVGMLAAHDPKEEKLREACAYVARENNAHFYWFYPEDISYSFPLIKGYSIHNGGWESRYFAYPDVIYDRLKEKGGVKYKQAYAKLQAIPSTEERKGGSFSKLKLYRMLESDSMLTHHLLPYLSVEDPEELLYFMSVHGASVIKHSRGSLGEKIVFVEPANDYYLVKDHHLLHRLTRSEMLSLLSSLCKKKGYLIQRFVHSSTIEGLPYYIRAHAVKNKYKEWQLLTSIAYISIDPNNKNANHNSRFWVFSDWEWFAKHQFFECSEEISARIETLVYQLTAFLDQNLNERISEIGIDIGIDEQSRIWLFEANMNRVGVNYRELEAAKIIIPSALSLIEQ
jgi:hypothetical protein